MNLEPGPFPLFETPYNLLTNIVQNGLIIYWKKKKKIKIRLVDNVNIVLSGYYPKLQPILIYVKYDKKMTIFAGHTLKFVKNREF